MPSMVAYSSWTELACSVAPWARDCAELESCSALPDIFISEAFMEPMALESILVRLSTDTCIVLKSPI